MEIDNFSIVVPVDYVLHTPEKPFCFDTTYPCHEDDLLTSEVAVFVREGLMTPEEATNFVAGRGM